MMTPNPAPDHADTLCLVIVNYASAGLVREMLSLISTERPVIIVDNFSSQEERRQIQEFAEQRATTAVLTSDNGGFGAGVNAGVKHGVSLGYRIFALLNPDLRVRDTVLDALRDQVSIDPTTVVTPRLVTSDGSTAFAASYLRLSDGHISARSEVANDKTSVAWLTAACLALHADVFESINGFDERYFMYWEDVDFSYRCLAVGARLCVRDDLLVIHDEGQTQGSRRGRAKSPLYYRYNIRNRMLFAATHLGRRQIMQWLIRSPSVSMEIYLRGGRRQLGETPAGAVSALQGFVEAVAIGCRALFGTRRASTSPP